MVETFKKRRSERLETAIMITRSSLEIITARPPEKKSPGIWLSQAEKCINKCEEYRKEGKIDQSWKCLNMASRLLIFGMDKDELDAQIKVFKSEIDKSEKIKKWRKDAILSLLDGVEYEHDIEKKRKWLFEARFVRDSTLDDDYYKIGLNEDISTVLFILSIIIPIIIIVLGFSPWFPNLIAPPDSNGMMLLLVALFGILGGTFSALLSLTFTSRLRIPSQLNHYLLTLLRVSISGSSAIVIYAFLVSGLLSFGPTTVGQVFAISFAAGFSERLVVRAAGLFEGDKKDEKKEESK